MRLRAFAVIVVVTSLVALASPAVLVAQDNHNHHKHHRYKLIDLGTLGVPQSFGDPAVAPGADAKDRSESLCGPRLRTKRLSDSEERRGDAT